MKCKKFKRSLTAGMFILFMLSAALLTGCAGGSDNNAGDKKYSIVCTIFPEYDWIRNVLGERADEFEVTMLVKSGTDLHSYQPSAADIAKISSCDLFVYTGGADSWADDALSTASNKEMKVISLFDVLGSDVKEEELVEGMEDEHSHNDENHNHDEIEYDEHIWLSLNNANKLVSAISDAISDLDDANKTVYAENAAAYLQQIAALDDEYKEAVKSAKRDTLLFGDRFPFRYLTEDYGLKYYAAFKGCSAETEASFETVTFLAGKLDELKLDTVLIIENSDEKLAKTIIQNSKSKNQQILVINSLQSVTAKDIKNGVTYLSVMKDNLEILKQALK